MVQSELRPVCPALNSPSNPVRAKLSSTFRRRRDGALASCCGSGLLTEGSEGFVEVNSTLIVYLCSTVQPASIRTVTGFLLLALYSSILDLK